MNASTQTPSRRPTEATGICDSTLTTLCDIESAPKSLRKVGRAVAQMITTDSGLIHVNRETKSLHVPYKRLRDLDIGEYRLCPNTKSDFRAFMKQTCIEASTAVLIGPRHVLTTAHSVCIGNIVSHHFVFNRTTNQIPLDTERKEWVIPPNEFYTGRSLVAYAYTPLVDWAIIELYRDVADIKPLGIGRWQPTAGADYLGHPLGLPLKHAKIRPADVDQTRSPDYLLAVDAGSGGSGSPIIQSGQVVGIVRGSAGVDPGTVVKQGCGPDCIDPSLSNCSCPQPFTPASHFAPCIPDITGW